MRPWALLALLALLPLCRAGLTTYASEGGKISLAINACGTNGPSCSLPITKPLTATTVRKAYAFYAATGFSSTSTAFNLDSVLLPDDATTATYIDSNWHNYAKDVTGVAATALNGLAGGATHAFTVSEASPYAGDGLILAVIFDDPGVATSNSVTLLTGHQNEIGDTFTLTLASPHDPATKPLTLSLGISFGYQPGGQVSIVNVNGQRLTSSAGGYDDGEAANGALITVGGQGDSRANPADPTLSYSPDNRYDDELFSLENLLQSGDTSATIFTQNPSNDDNIFFAALLAENQVVVVNPILDLSLAPTAASPTINTQQVLTATVVDSANSNAPKAGVTVTFTISGTAAQVLTATTNANGVATVSFTSAVVGISDVLASAPTAPSRTSTITWVKPVNSAPSCQLATATPGALWPPNHKLAPVTVSVPDVDGDEVTVEITSVRSSQATNTKGDGDTCPDAYLKPLLLRAERSGGAKPGRFYLVSFKATDSNDASCTGTVVVCVPHSAGVDCPAPPATFAFDATKCN